MYNVRLWIKVKNKYSLTDDPVAGADDVPADADKDDPHKVPVISQQENAQFGLLNMIIFHFPKRVKKQG